MQYSFMCPKCNKTAEINMRITEFHNDGFYCNCGTELVRDIKDIGTSFKVNCDGFFGKSK